ncbi:nucleotidyltransferase substrate binding protein [Candidatus Saganbacteria bacterium]|nr:nucleotidyltransferase substrate binding protein [Candidatus Saganbacteria bacterium]
MALDLSSLEKAVNSLKISLSIACSDEQMGKMSNDVKDTIRAGVIQNFELTYELCWKFMKRWLGNNLGSANIDGVNRRELFRLAAEYHLLSDVDKWMEYHDMRNETAHTYDKTTAKEVFESAVKFLKDAEEFLSNIIKQND